MTDGVVRAGEGDAAVGAGTAVCASPNDCPFHEGLQLYCCIDQACTADAPDACAGGGQRPVLASNYDQSCATDTDCIAIAEWDGCFPLGNCPTAAISKSADAQYQSDVAKAPCFETSGCVATFGPCCRNGACAMNEACGSPADTLPACAEAGGACGAFVIQCGDKGAGPPDSCAYPDEMCCLQ